MLAEAEQIFKVFADKNRLRIVHLLQQRKMCVCELAFILQVTQPSISRHLRRMKEVGLIGDEQDKFWTNYSLKYKSKACEDVMKSINVLIKEDKTIRADLNRLKMVDRTKLCCK